MRKNKPTYYFFHKASALLMILTLLWLTISTPFVCAFKQEMAKQAKMENTQPDLALEEDNSNPVGNNTEEKTPPAPTSITEEYIHHAESIHFFLSQSANFYQYINADTYTAFHGELLVPPPNAA